VCARGCPDLPQFEGAAVAPPRPTDTPAGLAAAVAEVEAEAEAEDDAVPQLRAAGGGTPALEIAPKEYADVQVEIENIASLEFFYAALRRTANQDAAAITRVAHYGDSSVAADEITQTLRRKLQRRFGDAGHGFHLTAGGDMHYIHRDVAHGESDGWELMSIVRRGLKSGYYGYGGVLARGWGSQTASFGTVDKGSIGHAVSRFEIFYQRHSGGGDLKLSVDGQLRETLRTRSDTLEDAWHRIDVPDGPHTLSIRTGGGEVRMYGVAQERSGPGVVYDALGLVGARADRLLDADPDHMAAQIAHRDPDMLVLAFGGNEAGNDWLDPRRYAESLREVIKLMMAGKPEMSCLLFSPLDQGERTPRGRIITLSVLPAIVLTQREVAKEMGCAFFDTWTAMGGEGAMARWYEARPRLVSSDLRHATPAGYAILGTAYYKALIKGFAAYLAKN
jgi:lysophospholipase L1-like esterase